MDAHVPQRQGVVRLSLAATVRRWPSWWWAIAWGLLLACLPWWIDLPPLLALAAIQWAQVPRLRRFAAVFRRALRWGFAGLLVASYRAFGGHVLGLTLTLLVALLGFSLLVLLESWRERKPRRDAALAAASPEWRELALAPVGPIPAIIELNVPVWINPEGDLGDLPMDVTRLGEDSWRVGERFTVERVQARVSIAPGQRWLAFPIAAGRGVVLYDRDHDRQYRLRGWQLYGWHAQEAWLTRSEDHAPLPLSHVLGQDRAEE
ncbi:MAG TPA: hypothetical protein VME63_17620 [Dyella sp.]|uniref:hypothetical protein n=1 Tax=Dyella sp. TaxID=1869338 RepID=UPI002B998641|nr:hypothetical protein [Dyella sp.]HTV87219.1 hypothetical protein [Dyella sp.]